MVFKNFLSLLISRGLILLILISHDRLQPIKPIGFFRIILQSVNHKAVL